MNTKTWLLPLSATLLLGLSPGLGAPAGAQTEINIEKATNGQDADIPPGPALVVGEPVTWTYQVTNTGGRDLIEVEVTDDQGVMVSCPATTLFPGESMTCTGNGTVQAGQYANVGTATGLLPNETPVSDTDPSHYFGQAALAIELEKATNGVDADTPPGPVLPAGSVVTWTYEVTNIGTEPLSDVAVTDDQGVGVTCPMTTLSPGESMTCTGAGTVQPGPYANLGAVMATLPDESQVSDTDPSHYFGQTLLLEKLTNGDDADLPPGPLIPVGDPITWTYEVSNPGPTTVTNLMVTDDQGVVVACPTTTLVSGQSVVCTGQGVALPGQYENLGTATATLAVGGQVTGSDVSHYFGEGQIFDFGDAPDPTYPTLLASDGARHLPSDVFLGACIDFEVDGQPTAAADGDDLGAGLTTTGTCATAGDDEDGVVFTTPLVIDSTAEIEVTASAACTLSAWIDFDQDGDWTDAGEDLFPGGQALVAGANPLSFPVPAGAPEGATTARFRCATAGAVGVTGEAADGEVEDYQVTVAMPIAISIDDVALAEGDAGTTPFEFTVTVSSTAFAVTVTATTANGTATAPADFAAAGPTMLTFPQGGPLTQTFTVDVAGDLAVEADETFTVVLSDPSAGAMLLDPSGQGTILDDDDGVSGSTLEALKTVIGTPVVGSTIQYVIEVTNLGPGAQSDNPGDELLDILPPEVALVDVTADVGVVTADVPANTVTWNGALAPAETATIVITVEVLPTAFGVTVSNQATLAFDTDNDGSNDGSARSDDPDVAGVEDPTLFLGVSVLEIPTLGGWGLIGLVLAVGLLGLRRIRRAELSVHLRRRDA